MHSSFPLYILILLFSFSFLSNVDAQGGRKKIKNRFKAGPVLGLSLSQIDGDNFSGYNKGNIIGGLSVEAVLSQKLALDFELLYNTKGAKIEASIDDIRLEVRTRTINLRYMEVPILLNAKLDDRENAPFVEVGGSFARLIGEDIKEPRTNGNGFFSYKPLIEQFNSNELNLIVGLGYNIKEHFRIKFRTTIGLTNFYDGTTPSEPVGGGSTDTPQVFEEIEFLRNYLVGILMSYYF